MLKRGYGRIRKRRTKDMGINENITFDEALKIAFERKAPIDLYTE